MPPHFVLKCYIIHTVLILEWGCMSADIYTENL